MINRLFIIAFLCLASCASIPKQAPILSEELGKKLTAIEKSHLSLLHLYFEQKRTAVEAFVTSEWIPEFTKNFFELPELKSAWDQIVQSNDMAERSAFLTAIGPQLQSSIDEKRMEFLKPLNDLEYEIENSIRAEYDLARSANNTLTSFLTNASKIEANRQRYLDMVGITEDKISSVISETDSILNELLENAQHVLAKESDLENFERKAATFKEEIKKLKEKIN